MRDDTKSDNAFPELKRLRFPHTMDPKESIPGFIVRCAGGDPVPRLKAIYDQIGFDHSSPGRLQLAENSVLDKAKYVTRSDDKIKYYAGRQINSSLIAFANQLLPARMFEFKLRRIAPRTMETDGIHRHEWLNKLLPYCSISGERLVSQCPSCTGNLGWWYTGGLDTCEHCETPVPASIEPPIAPAYFTRYKLFANALSIDPVVSAEAWATLPAVVQIHSPIAATELAMRVFRHLQYNTAARLRVRPEALDPDELVDTINGAMMLLEGWPGSMRTAIEKRVGAIGDNHKAFMSLWRRFRKMTEVKSHASIEQADMLLHALPDLADTVWRSFAPPYRTYLQQEAWLKTGFTAAQLSAAVEAGPLTVTTLPSSNKRKISYKAEEIDHLRWLNDTSTPFTSVASRFKLPIYGVEQLAAAQILEYADEPMLRAAHVQLRMRTSSIETFAQSFSDDASKRRPPKEIRTLSDAIRMHGGDEHPWGPVFSALLRKEIEWWVKDDKVTTTTIFVRPQDLWNLRPNKINSDRLESLNQPGISKKDAAWLLNVKPKIFLRIEKEENVETMRVSKADVASKKAILEIARTYMSFAEINERWKAFGRSGDWMNKLKDMDARRAGWPRELSETVLRIDKPW